MQVSGFTMKMSISSAESVIDNFIRRYRDLMGATVPTGRNYFNYGTQYPTDAVLFFRFNEAQRCAHRFMEGTLYDICNESGYGSVECMPLFDLRMSKIYQELSHDIMWCIPRRVLDDVPATTRTMRIWTRQLQGPLQRWSDMPREL